MKVWNLNINRGADGSKHLDLQIHGVIDGGWWDDGTGVVSAEIIGEMNKHLDAKTIGVRINSIGGSAFGGVAVYNALQSHPAEVTCTVEGLAVSAASLIAMAGKCTMGRGAMMMIHSPSTGVAGNANDLRKVADFLDKVQSSLATIYTAKTGKSFDEINKLIDAETWMTADEAVAAGFADSVGDAKTEPSAPQMAGESLIWCGVKFPNASLPHQILAMAAPPLIQAQQEPKMKITREVLTAEAPELLAALAKEGHDAGVASERARLKAIDELDVPGSEALAKAAKYDAPATAEALAVTILKAQKQAGIDLLAARQKESAAVGAVRPGAAPVEGEEAERARLVKSIVKGGVR